MSVNLGPTGLTGHHYQNTYSYSDSFTTAHQQIVPNGALSSNQAYLILVDTTNGSYGKPPYYSSAVFMLHTAPGTNSNFTNGTTGQEPMLATHVGSNSYFNFRITGGMSSKNGLAMRFYNGPTSVSSGLSLRVTCIKLANV